MKPITAQRDYLVVGLGATGLSCVRFLRARGQGVAVVDSRAEPPGRDVLQRDFPEVELTTGAFSADQLKQADILVMSPGVPLATPAIKAAIDAGVPVTSDIELFHQAFDGRLVLITGSNAKSTVTSWVADMARLSRQAYVVGGNLGKPALELLEEPADLAILELSSFQLELLPPMISDVATILNVSEDHLDRYDSFDAYREAKLRIYRGAKQVVFNRADALTQTPLETPEVSFGLDQPAAGHFGLVQHDGEEWLAQGDQPLLPSREVALPGRHNLVNALASLALGSAVDLPHVAMLESLRSFKGLPHRCEWVATKAGVRYVNDSKGTNVGATLAAVEGLGREAPGRLILLVGGQGKDADFAPLTKPVNELCKSVFAYGEDGDVLASVIGPLTQRVERMEDAFAAAVSQAIEGDTVLLSPACASFDQFRNFEHRGDVFRAQVEALS
ncbi:UDP-N-acetylmuramoylalanine--D-glutamate ligase [Saccharospirillum sp. MSK14-1]|uniref:UDP-N-acetylmuramoyl-L-alanine--D-glutamate ligase n=1 Tax=Saccharospirillum sp. MSK14-1 TaxID=1897632 RepID=UPI000D370EF0|nr:UDP-N-acetylmuramoyl-L-alanine--D-glutamate ligase [Saccharospirillum sp. MSK14-1]PTY38977.1 UDP-N-acetylmuramoylalanine--D-glutamate ligase [Saccharospirillum sp. MSK14-1]